MRHLEDLRASLNERYPERHRVGWGRARRHARTLFVVWVTVAGCKIERGLHPVDVVAEIRVYSDSIDTAEAMAMAAVEALR